MTTVGRAPAVAKERAELQQQFDALKAPMDAATAAFKEALPGFQQRNAELDALDAQIKAAKHELAENVRDEEILSGLAAITLERQQLAKKIEVASIANRKMREQIGERETVLSHTLPPPAPGGWTRQSEDPAEKKERIRRELAAEYAVLSETESAVLELERDRRNLDARENAVRERMVVAVV